jgi:hypothetical protein
MISLLNQHYPPLLCCYNLAVRINKTKLMYPLIHFYWLETQWRLINYTKVAF